MLQKTYYIIIQCFLLGRQLCFLLSKTKIRSKVLSLLLAKGKITPDHIHLLQSWKHSEFQVFCGPRIHPRKIEAMENLARYVIQASFSQERLRYDAQSATVVYKGKDGSRRYNSNL